MRIGAEIVLAICLILLAVVLMFAKAGYRESHQGAFAFFSVDTLIALIPYFCIAIGVVVFHMLRAYFGGKKEKDR